MSTDTITIAPAPEQKAEAAGPKVRARIEIILYEDGNCLVDGPFDDRVLFAGLLHIASEVDRDMYARRVGEAQRTARERAQESWWGRRQRERREAKAKAEAERLARVAGDQPAVTKQ